MNEPFGIAVAEMVRGGSIVFVPGNGGQIEIVGGDAWLLYDTNEKAVAKILRVMKNHDIHDSIRTNLESRKALFTTHNFIKHIRKSVKYFLGELPSTPKLNSIGNHKT